MGLHLLLLLAWWTSRLDMPVHRKDGSAATVTVWLREPSRLAIEPVKKKRMQGATSSGRAFRRDDDDPEGDPAVSLGPLTTDGNAPVPSAEIASATPPKPPLSPLKLSLSREALKSLAAPGLADRFPFQGRLPVTVESQIAEVAAETGPWTEERIDADHIRLRRGTTCVVLSRPEIAKIDPFNDAMRRMPWAATAFKCR